MILKERKMNAAQRYKSFSESEPYEAIIVASDGCVGFGAGGSTHGAGAGDGAVM